METDLPCFLSCVHELSYVSGEQVNGDINVLLKCYDLKKGTTLAQCSESESWVFFFSADTRRLLLLSPALNP